VLARPHIYQFEVTLTVNNGVLRFEIAVDNVSLMQILQCEQHRSDIKATILAAKQPHFPDYFEQFKSVNELCEEVHKPLVLEASAVL